jgi:cell wall-associated NlpC family hydrolase
MRQIHRIATFLIVGTIALSGRAAVAYAAEEPVAGISVVLEECYRNTPNADDKIIQYLSVDLDKEYSKLAFAKVNNYVNIRSKASLDGEIVGKLYDNSAATILKKENNWYQIKSGSVTGYINADYLVTGQEAAKLADTIGTRIATVTTETLKVREEAGTDSSVVTLIPFGDDYEILKEKNGWVKIALSDNKTGYVSADYVKVETEYEEAVSIEEEQERLAEEAAAEAAERAAAQAAERVVVKKPSSSVGQAKYSGSVSTGSSSVGNNLVDYALQFEGNPYVWGGTSLTNGADCSGFTQSVFAHFGISIPRTSRTQATGGSRVSLDNIRPGDLIFYAKNGTINHVALYIGNGRVISASSPSTGIRITSYNYRTPVKAVRYLN